MELLKGKIKSGMKTICLVVTRIEVVNPEFFRIPKIPMTNKYSEHPKIFTAAVTGLIRPQQGHQIE